MRILSILFTLVALLGGQAQAQVIRGDDAVVYAADDLAYSAESLYRAAYNASRRSSRVLPDLGRFLADSQDFADQARYGADRRDLVAQASRLDNDFARISRAISVDVSLNRSREVSYYVGETRAALDRVRDALRFGGGRRQSRCEARSDYDGRLYQAYGQDQRQAAANVLSLCRANRDSCRVTVCD